VTIASLVLGILGTIFGLIPGLFFVGLPLAALALVLGVLGRKQALTAGQPTGMGTAGIALGVIGVVIGVTMWVLCSMCTNAARKGWEKALNDPEFQKKLNDPKFNKDFDDAFANALKDAAKRAEEQKKGQATPAPAPAPAPPAPAPQPQH
jgi:hypothetical protein